MTAGSVDGLRYIAGGSVQAVLNRVAIGIDGNGHLVEGVVVAIGLLAAVGVVDLGSRSPLP